jgi:hypothetical protein
MSFAIIDYFSYNFKFDQRWLFADNPTELLTLVRAYMLSLVRDLTNRDYYGPASIEEIASFLNTSINLNNEFFKRNDRININVFI